MQYYCFTDQIKKGRVLKEISEEEWTNLEQIVVTFKISSFESGKRAVMVLTDKNTEECCEEKDALAGIWIGRIHEPLCTVLNSSYRVLQNIC